MMDSVRDHHELLPSNRPHKASVYKELPALNHYVLHTYHIYRPNDYKLSTRVLAIIRDNFKKTWQTEYRHIKLICQKAITYILQSKFGFYNRDYESVS